MPVFYSPVPQNLRGGLGYPGGSVFTNNRTADSSDYFRDQDYRTVNELVSYLPLQMLLYFNMFFFPCWWISAVLMLHLKFSYLAGYYQALLVTGLVLLTLFEVIRLHLGFVGNLTEEVPQVAGFWLLSLLFQLPILLFFLTDEDIIILPLERAVHSIYLLFLLAQLATSFLALQDMTHKLSMEFHLRQFGEMESLRPAAPSPAYGLASSRSVLPMPPSNNNVHLG